MALAHAVAALPLREAIVLRELAEPSGMPPGTLAALCAITIPENLGYRQIRNLWLVAGFFGAPSAKRPKATAEPAAAKA